MEFTVPNGTNLVSWIPLMSKIPTVFAIFGFLLAVSQLASSAPLSCRGGDSSAKPQKGRHHEKISQWRQADAAVREPYTFSELDARRWPRMVDNSSATKDSTRDGGYAEAVMLPARGRQWQQGEFVDMVSWSSHRFPETVPTTGNVLRIDSKLLGDSKERGAAETQIYRADH